STGRPARARAGALVRALPSREQATLRANGAESKFGIEPLSYYGVWRAMHEINDRRQGIGLMTMTTARFFDGNSDPLRDEVNRGSVVTALDGWTFLHKKKLYGISGHTAAARGAGTATRC